MPFFFGPQRGFWLLAFCNFILPFWLSVWMLQSFCISLLSLLMWLLVFSSSMMSLGYCFSIRALIFCFLIGLVVGALYILDISCYFLFIVNHDCFVFLPVLLSSRFLLACLFVSLCFLDISFNLLYIVNDPLFHSYFICFISLLWFLFSSSFVLGFFGLLISSSL